MWCPQLGLKLISSFLRTLIVFNLVDLLALALVITELFQHSAKACDKIACKLQRVFCYNILYRSLLLIISVCDALKKKILEKFIIRLNILNLLRVSLFIFYFFLYDVYNIKFLIIQLMYYFISISL